MASSKKWGILGGIVLWIIAFFGGLTLIAISFAYMDWLWKILAIR